MVHQRMGFIYLVLLTVINNAASSVCKISLNPDFLRITKKHTPLIYKYKSDGTPVNLYPSHTKCIFPSEVQELRLACPGVNNTILFYYFGVMYEPRFFTENSSFVHLLHDPSDSRSVLLRGAGPYSVKSRHYIECSELPVAKMYLLNTTKDTASKGYAVGYRLNDVDFLKVYEQVYRDEEWIVTRYNISPAILSRPGFYDSQRYKKGLFFQKKTINFHDLYAKEYQVAEFQRYFKNTELSEKYFAGNNSLVMGQLMLEEDTFYYSHQMSARFYENTAPIWKSVYEGNWLTIGSIIRTIADASTTDLDVQVCAWPSYQTNWSGTWSLGNTSSSPDTAIPVPKLLVKVAIDVVNPDRGIVFHTFNDPYLDREKAEEQIEDYCMKTTDCRELHPEFDDTYKGYTFCCKPKDSHIFKKIEGY